MESAFKCGVPEGQSGNCRVEKFVATAEDEKFERLRCAFSFSSRGRMVRAGEYTRLIVGGNTMMSDTPYEINDQRAIISYAKNHVLINGLGLGITAELCLNKPEVSKVTVVELNPDVIKLVSPYLTAKYGERIEIIQADAFEYKPRKGSRFGAVWHDIWLGICEDNLPDMHRLHRKYGRLADWQGSWGRHYIEARLR